MGTGARRAKIKRALKRSNVHKEEMNDSALKKLHARAGQHDCKYCPEWKGDNQVGRKPKRGAKKPRHKDKR